MALGYQTAEKASKPFVATQEHSQDMLTERYEFKYRVPEPIAIAVESYVRNYLDLDKYAAAHSSGQYSICSLYFDSPDFDLFQETILDKCNRFKLRVRGYEESESAPLFFEIKRKLNRIIYKSRAKINQDCLSSLINSNCVPPDLPAPDRRILAQFKHYSQGLQARPVVRVRYLRKAYEDLLQSKVRVTFDRYLCYQPAEKPIFRMGGRGWKPVPIDFVIIEIKFTKNYPRWLKDMVCRFNLYRESMSKYCSSIVPLVPGGSSLYSVPIFR